MDGEVHEVGLDGRIHLNGLRHPVLAVVSAPGHLSEPVAVGRDDRKEPVDVPLLSAAGRHVVHTAGDMMMGPRYLDGNDGYAHVDPDDEGSSARAVVSDIAPAFSLADLSMVNLETVIGARPDADAYPGKRYLLQTPPSALAALDALGADLTVLANNHQRDWLDAGITDGLGFLDAVGQEHVGAAITDEAARATWTDDADWKVAVLAYTAVDGDTVNDQYPVDGDVGEERDVTVLISDIRGFTPLTEQLGAADVVTLLNEYFTLLVDVVMAEDGVIDKFMGDAMLCYFGAPVAQADHRERAVRTGIRILEALARWNGERAARGLAPIATGIGIATGRVIVGNIGSSQRMEYTAIGDAVNLASRLCGKADPGQIVVTDLVREAVQDPRFSPGGSVPVKGFAQLVPIHRLSLVAPPSGRADRVSPA